MRLGVVYLTDSVNVVRCAPSQILWKHFSDLRGEKWRLIRVNFKYLFLIDVAYFFAAYNYTLSISKLCPRKNRKIFLSPTTSGYCVLDVNFEPSLLRISSTAAASLGGHLDSFALNASKSAIVVDWITGDNRHTTEVQHVVYGLWRWSSIFY